MKTLLVCVGSGGTVFVGVRGVDGFDPALGRRAFCVYFFSFPCLYGQSFFLLQLSGSLDGLIVV